LKSSVENTDDRPGLQHFLDTMSEFYEMHVYTMGTRTYANAICKVIDPGGKIFGDRILSRDESGSEFSWRLRIFSKLMVDFTSKNLKRLFPTDQSMVVVIDDRQDVWGDCPNLLKVVPCKLFYSGRQDEAEQQTTSS
jgi:RNA polymerase II subunit A-like phosphatase